MSSSVINRRLDIEEIQYVVAALNDTELITLLEAVRDNPVALGEAEVDEDENLALVGWSRETIVIGEGTDEEDARKRGVLARMIDMGLINKGGYIPIDEAQINAYKLTDAGYALLEGVPEEEPTIRAPTSAAPQRKEEKEESIKDTKKQEPPREIVRPPTKTDNTKRFSSTGSRRDKRHT